MLPPGHPGLVLKGTCSGRVAEVRKHGPRVARRARFRQRHAGRIRRGGARPEACRLGRSLSGEPARIVRPSASGPRSTWQRVRSSPMRSRLRCCASGSTAGLATGVLLDGFPRTMEQAIALSEMMESLHRQVDGVLYVDVPDEALVERLSGRLICRECQAPFHRLSEPVSELPHSASVRASTSISGPTTRPRPCGRG